MTLMDKGCWERGCAHYDYRDKEHTVKVGLVDEIRNATLEEVAKEFDAMKYFGDTAMSFAAYVRGMKRAKT